MTDRTDTHSTNQLPNSVLKIQERIDAGRITWRWPVIMLLFRTVSFAVWQFVIAALLALGGHPDAIDASAAWWPVTSTVTNILTILLLVWLARREGIRAIDLISWDRTQMKRNILLALGILIVSAPLAYIPNVFFGTLLFGSMDEPFALFFRPLPVWISALSLVLFPVTIALSELPTYFGYAMPRLAGLSRRAWVGILLAAFWLAAQHMALPLILDWRFLAWRFVMFAPFALLLAVAIYWRPRVLPYLMIGHGLLDFQIVWLVWMASLSA